LPPPVQVSQGINTGKPPVKSALKTNNGPANTNNTAASSANAQGGSLFEGAFDEGDSHNSFLDALKAWRGEPPSDAAASEEPKSVRFSGEEGKPGPKKNFFANLDNNDFNVNCLPEPPTFSEGGTLPDAQMSDPKYGPKDSCWQCYKLFPSEQALVCKISQKVSLSYA